MLMRSNVLYAARVLKKSPKFTATVLVTLALGIGANAGIFSVVSAVLVRRLPIRDPQNVVVLHDQFPTLNLPRTTVSVLQFRDFSQRTDLFQSAAVLKETNLTLAGQGQALRLQGMQATSQLFSLLGVRPELGRDFTSQDDTYGSARVALLSHGLWQRLFGSDRAVVGRQLRLDTNSYEIIGVLPKDIETLYPHVEVWVPAAFDAESLNPKYRWYVGYSMLARLAPGVNLQRAQAGMVTAAANFNQGSFDQYHVEVRSLMDDEVGNVRSQMYLVWSAVGLLLLLACANVANLVMARNEGRASEIAIRSALGCPRMRLVGQLFTESLLLALGGGAVGFLLAGPLVRLLIGFAPADVPRIADVHLDFWVVLWTFAICLISSVLFGVLPAFLSTRVQIAESLKTAGRGATIGQRSFGNALVVSQVGLALVLLVGAGLLLRTFERLIEVKPGFAPANVVTMRFSFPLAAMNLSETASLMPYDPAHIASFSSSLLDRISSVPGVSEVATATGAPFASEDYNGTFEIKGRQADSTKPTPHANVTYATPQYFRALKIPLIRGRFYTPAEMRATNWEGNGAVRIIDETLAKRFWPGQDPIGSEIGSKEDGWATIIGVVGDVRDTDLTAESKGTIYFPGYVGTTLIVKTKSNPTAFVAAIREAIHDVDSGVPVYDVKSMQDLVAASLERRKFATLLLTLFAALALALASVGLYAVLSYVVARRTKEVGIRIAIGASREDVLQLIFRHGLVMTVSGVVLGLGISLLLKPLIASQLFGIRAFDGLTLGLASVLLVVTALVAIFVPANRAMRVDPMIALRHE
jgi:putative ABC transport system permease protein